MIVYPSCCSCLNDKPKKKGCTCSCHRPIDWSGCPDCGAKTLSRNEKGEHLGCPTKKLNRRSACASVDGNCINHGACNAADRCIAEKPK